MTKPNRAFTQVREEVELTRVMIWGPFWFVAAVAVATTVIPLIFYFAGFTRTVPWYPWIFILNVPMGFFFVCNILSLLRRDNLKLRQRLDELEKQ